MGARARSLLAGRFAALVSVIAACLRVTPAVATPLAAPPPVYTIIDGNGVDLVTGLLNYSTTEVTIGLPGQGGLAYTRTWIGPGWRDNFVGTINSSGSTYTVSIGNASETFTLSGGSFTSNQARGATLTFDGAHTYIYTTANGAQAIFDTTYANGGATFDANVARITSMTMPSGESTTWHYKSVSVTISGVATPGLRVQSITNNLGYQLKFDYSNNNPTTQAELDAWKTMTKVTGVNNAIEYCDPTADTCTFSNAWPSASYSSSGGYETVTDTMSRATRYGIGTYGLTSIRRPSSSSTDHITIVYNVNHTVDSYSNSTGTWHYTGSKDNNLDTLTSVVTDPNSNTRTVTSQISSGIITSDRFGPGYALTTYYQHDGNNRISRITYPEGNYVSYDYDGRGNITTTTFVPKSGSGLSNITTSASFDSSCSSPSTCNRPNSTTDAGGHTTNYTYDSHGNVTKITLPDPDGAGSLVRPETRYSYTAEYAYYFTSSGGSVVQAATPVDRLTAVSSCATSASCSGGSDETKATLDYGSTGVANNLLRVSSSVGAGDGSLTSTTTFTHDNIGNVLTIDGPLSDDTVTYRYDADRELVGVITPDPDGAGSLKRRAIRVNYNADGQVTSTDRGTVTGVTDSDWSAFATLQTLSTTYDFDGRPIQRALSAGGTTYSLTQASYDNAGRLTCTTGRMNPSVFGSLPSSACTLSTQGSYGPDRIRQITYDERNRITAVTRAYGTSDAMAEQNFTYTYNGLVGTLLDANGNTTTYDYDGFDRISKIHFPNPSGGGSSSTDYEQYSYDAASNVTSDRRRSGDSISYSYDALNRRTQLTYPGDSSRNVTYVYDNFNRITSEAFSAQTLSFSYDQLSRNTSQTSPLGTVSFQHDLDGRRTRTTWPDNFYVAYDYDTVNEMTAIRENGATSGAGVLATYTYDDLGRRVTLTRGNATTESETYDSASNLTQLVQDLSGTTYDQTLTYTYNPANQQLSRAGSNTNYQWAPLASGTTNYTTNGLNQYNAVGGTTYTYDSRGNLTSNGSNYSYDLHNQMTGAPSSASLTYDPGNRLYQTSAGGATTRFLYDGGQIIAEYNSSGSILRRYIFGPGVDEPTVWYEGSGTTDRRWLVADRQGSIIAVTDVTGAAMNVNTYDEFGNRGSGNVGRFQFSGEPWISEASQQYNRARFYSGAIGRFMQPDPLLTNGGMNIYGFVGNDPLNLADPRGLDAHPPYTVSGQFGGCSWWQTYSYRSVTVDGVTGSGYVAGDLHIQCDQQDTAAFFEIDGDIAVKALGLGIGVVGGIGIVYDNKCHAQAFGTYGLGGAFGDIPAEGGVAGGISRGVLLNGGSQDILGPFTGGTLSLSDELGVSGAAYSGVSQDGSRRVSTFSLGVNVGEGATLITGLTNTVPIGQPFTVTPLETAVLLDDPAMALLQALSGDPACRGGAH